MVSDLGTVGGAAIAASRLASGLSASRWTVARFACTHLGAVAGTVGDWSVEPSITRRVVRRVGDIALKPDRDRTLRGPRARRLLAQLLKFHPEVINLHNIHDVGLPVTILRDLARIAPVVWTLHDMWPIGGGCLNALKCTQLQRGCTGDGECPWPFPGDVSPRPAREWRVRAELHSSLDNVAYVAPSRWLARIAQDGVLAGRRVEIIPNGIDDDEFKPVDRLAARESFGLSRDAVVVLFCCAWLDDPLKGLAALTEALENLGASTRNLTLVTVGETTEPWRMAGDNYEHVHVGLVTSTRILRMCYSAADVLALPTRADNLPNTAIEALACGTPCAAFDVGGVGEVVRDGDTGFLATPDSPQALALALERVVCLDESHRLRMARRCREVAQQEYSLRLCAARYSELFWSMTASG